MCFLWMIWLCKNRIIKKLSKKKTGRASGLFNTYEKGAQSFLCFTKIRSHRHCQFIIGCIGRKKNRNYFRQKKLFFKTNHKPMTLCGFVWLHLILAINCFRNTLLNLA